MADLTNKTQNLLNISVTKPATGPAAVAPGLLNNYLNNTLPGAGNKISQIRFPNAANQLATTLNNILPGAGNGIGNPTSAPPKATAAPVGNNGYMFTGLSEALNTYQKNLVISPTFTNLNSTPRLSVTVESKIPAAQIDQKLPVNVLSLHARPWIPTLFQ